jgi:hypothetical protein
MEGKCSAPNDEEERTEEEEEEEETMGRGGNDREWMGGERVESGSKSSENE